MVGILYDRITIPTEIGNGWGGPGTARDSRRWPAFTGDDRVWTGGVDEGQRILCERSKARSACAPRFLMKLPILYENIMSILLSLLIANVSSQKYFTTLIDKTDKTMNFTILFHISLEIDKSSSEEIICFIKASLQNVSSIKKYSCGNLLNAKLFSRFLKNLRKMSCFSVISIWLKNSHTIFKDEHFRW